MTPNRIKALIADEIDAFVRRETLVSVEPDSSDPSLVLIDVHTPSDDAIYRLMYETLKDPGFIDRHRDGLA
jgi:hypothetical protein